MLNFPNAPTNGTTFGQWVYDGTKWTQGNAASVSVVNTFNSRSGAVTLSTADVTAVADGTYVHLAGDTMTGNLSISNNNWPSITLNPTVASVGSGIVGSRSGSPRWQIQFPNSSSETGSNAGSDFGIWRYTDAGGIIDSTIFISRATGNVNFSQSAIAAGTIQSNNGHVVAKGGTGQLAAVNTANNLGVTLMSWSDGTSYIARTDANGTYNGTILSYWDSSGNLTQTQSLYVSGTFWGNGGRIVSTNNNGNPSFTMYNQAWGGVSIFVDASGQLVFGGGNSNGTPLDYSRMVIDSAANVTIKNVLALTGGYGIRYNSGSYSNGYTFLFGWANVVSGSVTCGIENGGAACTFVNACDERLKLDIAPSQFDCLDTVMKLPLREYRWLDTDDPWKLREARDAARPRTDVDKRRIGVIAQEIHKIFPEGVIEGDTFDDHLGRVWGLDQNNMIALLLGAVQQMQDEIDLLKAQR